MKFLRRRCRKNFAFQEQIRRRGAAEKKQYNANQLGINPIRTVLELTQRSTGKRNGEGGIRFSNGKNGKTTLPSTPPEPDIY